MTDARLDIVTTSIISACGFPGGRLSPKALAHHLGIPREQARRALRRAARKGALVGGRVPATS